MIRHANIAPCPGSARAPRASDRALAVGTHARHRASLPHAVGGNESHSKNSLPPRPFVRPLTFVQRRAPRSIQCACRAVAQRRRVQSQLAAPKHSEGGSKPVKVLFQTPSASRSQSMPFAAVLQTPVPPGRLERRVQCSQICPTRPCQFSKRTVHQYGTQNVQPHSFVCLGSRHGLAEASHPVTPGQRIAAPCTPPFVIRHSSFLRLISPRTHSRLHSAPQT